MSENLTDLPYSEEHYFNRKFKDRHSGEVFTCLGVMLGDDDWYYVMWSRTSGEKGLRLLSCVGDLIAGWHFEPVEA